MHGCVWCVGMFVESTFVLCLPVACLPGKSNIKDLADVSRWAGGLRGVKGPQGCAWLCVGCSWVHACDCARNAMHARVRATSRTWLIPGAQGCC